MIAATVILPTYQQAPAYLTAAIVSALQQTVPVQVVVIDDGSEPRQEPLVVLAEQLARQVTGLVHPQTVIEYHWQRNLGVAGALNAGIALARGPSIHWLSSDDLFTCRKAEAHYHLYLAGGSPVSYCTYEEGIPLARATWAAAQYPTREALYEHLQQHCFIYACSCCWHRSVFDTVGLFDGRFRHVQDYHFLLRCAQQWNFTALHEPLARRRVHSGQMINLLKQEKEMAIKTAEIEQLKADFGVSAAVWRPS